MKRALTWLLFFSFATVTTFQNAPLAHAAPLNLPINLIGNPTNQPITVQALLNNLVSGTDYTQVLRYDSTLPAPSYVTLAPTDTVKVGESVYVKLTHDATWNLPTASSLTTFAYDGDGGRVKKTINGTETLYIGGLYEKTGSNATKYVMLGSQRIAAKDSSGTSFYHSDHLGGTNVVTNATGAQTELLEYKPYGSLQRNEGTQDKEHKFTGQRLDASTGLYFYNARYYDSELGRFIQPDTIVSNPANPQDLNRYTYANNNPTSNVDPTGYSWKSFWKSFVGTVVAGVVTVVAVAFAPYLLPAAPYIFGGVSGGVTGGLNGGWQGALIGAGMGIATAGAVMYGGPIVTAGLLVGGGVSSYQTGGWSGLGDYASALAGGILGAPIGLGIGRGIADALQSGSLANQTGSARIGNRGPDQEGRGPQIHSKTVPFDPEHPGYANDGPAAKGYRYVGLKEATFAEKYDFVPNWTESGESKPVFLTPDSPLTSASQARSTYNLETTPTHRITVDITRTKLTYGGNVQVNSTAIEITTQETVPVSRVDPLDR